MARGVAADTPVPSDVVAFDHLACDAVLDGLGGVGHRPVPHGRRQHEDEVHGGEQRGHCPLPRIHVQQIEHRASSWPPRHVNGRQAHHKVGKRNALQDAAPSNGRKVEAPSFPRSLGQTTTLKHETKEK